MTAFVEDLLPECSPHEANESSGSTLTAASTWPRVTGLRGKRRKFRPAGRCAADPRRGCTGEAVAITRDERLVAGPQAALAPHGRGQGWGARSATARVAGAWPRRSIGGGRKSVADASLIRAAVDALARGSDHVVAAVPDLDIFDEAVQGAMLKAMSSGRRRARLLWRPVAVFIDLLARGRILPEAEGAHFRILVHSGSGIEDQLLTLRRDPEHPDHFAPERSGPGTLCAPGAGLDVMFARAARMVKDFNHAVVWDRCEPSRLGPKLLTGEKAPSEIEILRAWNGNWVAVSAPDIAPVTLGLDAVELSPPCVPVAGTFLVTPLAAQFASTLAHSISHSAGSVQVIGPEAVAQGCLLAGRLIERGLPHYFDRLEPVAIAVLRGDAPAFDYLIAPKSVVPANREYVSRELAGFEWGKGKSAIEFYVLKGEAEMRHWRVTKEVAPPQDVPVALRIRQTPGQSWARLTVTSHSWEPLSRSPVALDWETLTPIDLSPDEVLAKLRTPPPTIPERIVERPHLDLWMGADWAGNGEASRLARAAARGEPVAPGRWAAEIRQARRHPEPPHDRFWLVGTDGDLPDGLPQDVREGFGVALDRLAASACAATLGRPPRDNELLIALTWCFIRCPEAVQDGILDALDAHARGQRHPLSLPPHAIRVLRQGAGRAVSGVARFERLFSYLDKAPINSDTLNALAMVLSRREESPQAPTREQVDRFLNRLGRELIARIEARDFKIRFRNTLSAIAGLFRWRKREPFALLAARDPVAAQLRETLTMIPFSILDLAPVPEGATVRQSLSNTLDLARHADAWGYRRFWLAEHHNMEGIASAATAVVIGAVAAATRTIRVGRGRHAAEPRAADGCGGLRHAGGALPRADRPRPRPGAGRRPRRRRGRSGATSPARTGSRRTWWSSSAISTIRV
jgi:hypothetical protein